MLVMPLSSVTLSLAYLHILTTKQLRSSAGRLHGCTGPHSADGQQLPGARTLPRQCSHH